MLELAILGFLKEQPLHGYELKKRLGETLGFLSGSRTARSTRRLSRPRRRVRARLKSPPVQHRHGEARQMVGLFAGGE